MNNVLYGMVMSLATISAVSTPKNQSLFYFPIKGDEKCANGRQINCCFAMTPLTQVKCF